MRRRPSGCRGSCARPMEWWHLSVRPGSIFPSRPCGSCRHGAQGRGKPGRRAAPRRELDISRPRLARPSTVLPLREAVPILGMALLLQELIPVSREPGWRYAERLQRAPAGAGVTRMGGNRVSGFRRAAIFWPRGSTRPEPRRGEGPAHDRKRSEPVGVQPPAEGNVTPFPDGLPCSPRR